MTDVSSSAVPPLVMCRYHKNDDAAKAQNRAMDEREREADSTYDDVDADETFAELKREQILVNDMLLQEPAQSLSELSVIDMRSSLPRPRQGKGHSARIVEGAPAVGYTWSKGEYDRAAATQAVLSLTPEEEEELGPLHKRRVLNQRRRRLAAMASGGGGAGEGGLGVWC